MEGDIISTIPQNITREHVLKAIEEIDRVGVPARRASRTYLIKYNGLPYPPKHLIALANKYANGKELHLSEFNGGSEMLDFLRERGFEITSPREYKEELEALSDEIQDIDEERLYMIEKGDESYLVLASKSGMRRLKNKLSGSDKPYTIR